jgi:hypothetical protein
MRKCALFFVFMISLFVFFFGEIVSRFASMCFFVGAFAGLVFDFLLTKKPEESSIVGPEICADVLADMIETYCVSRSYSLIEVNSFLLEITSAMPMKVIAIDGEDYLQRYYIGTDESGVQYWLHRFLRNDSERHLHCHPWRATSTILVGWYKEQLLGGVVRGYRAGDRNTIDFTTYHRIAEVLPDTWTLMRVDPERHPTWDFIDDDGGRKLMKTSEINWYEGCGLRGSK